MGLSLYSQYFWWLMAEGILGKKRKKAGKLVAVSRERGDH